MAHTVISIESVTKRFGGGLFSKNEIVTAAENVDLTVRSGETLGIVGESGSGKSTLLRMVLRLIRPTAGRVTVDGQDIWALKGRELKMLRRRMQPIFQNPASSFNPRQTIGQILTAPLEVHGLGSSRARRNKAAELLERVGLDASYARRMPHQLSGGQKQRVAIARAVILEPDIVLADEPTSALDVSVQAQVLELFSEIKREFGLTTIFVSHNLAVIRQVSDRVAVMRHGQLLENGDVDQIFDDPQHDYTKTLLAAVPDPRSNLKKEELTS